MQFLRMLENRKALSTVPRVMRGKHGPVDHDQKENFLELKPAQLKPLKPARGSPED